MLATIIFTNIRIFIGGGLSVNYDSSLYLNVLESFFALNRKKLNINRGYVKRFFLDSGAFSAWSKKRKINLDRYIQYILDNKREIDYYANLDVIYNSEESQENLDVMEAVDLHPIPVYHYKEDFNIFKEFCEKYEYIALGGMVPISTPRLIPFLDEVFEYICDEDGTTKKKIHGFGMTTLELMKRYPWYSVDSISPILTGAMGGVYNEQGQVVSVAWSKHIPETTKIYLGDVNPKIEWTNVKFKKNPFMQGFNFDKIRDDYKARVTINLRYMMALEKELTDNPPRFKSFQKRLI